ncbi:hypothetical protein Tco_0621204, partial [Tanacetum coccineum]
EDEVFPAEEQPLPAAASPTAQPLNYVPEPIYLEYMPQEDEVFPAEE